MNREREKQQVIEIWNQEGYRFKDYEVNLEIHWRHLFNQCNNLPYGADCENALLVAEHYADAIA